jgi:hypothetical protein
MFRWIAVIFCVALAGCTYTAQVAPTTAAASAVLPQRQIELPSSYYVTDEIASLNRSASEGYMCSANKFDVNAGPAIASSIRSVNQTAFKSISEGGTLTQPAEGAKWHIVFELDSFTPRIHFEPGFWSATSIANVELVLKVTAYDESAKQILRISAAGDGYGESDGGGCSSGADALSIATNEAIKRTMESYVNQVVNAGQLTQAP